MKKFLQSPLTPVLLIPVLLLLGVGFVRQFKNYYNIQARLDTIQERAERAETQNKEIKNSIEAFNNPATIEKEARSRLNLKKEGEHVVIILPNEQERQQNQQQAENQQQPEPESVWQKIKNWFAN